MTDDQHDLSLPAMGHDLSRQLAAIAQTLDAVDRQQLMRALSDISDESDGKTLTSLDDPVGPLSARVFVKSLRDRALGAEPAREENP